MHRVIIATSAYDAAAKLHIDLVTLYRKLGKKKIAAVKDNGRWKVFLLELASQPGAEATYISLPYSALGTIVGEDVAALVKEE